MAFTTEFVMGAGGAEVQSQVVAWDTTGAASGSVTPVAAIATGSVRNWRIVFSGTESNHYRTTLMSEVLINGNTIGNLGSGTPGFTGFSALVTGSDLIDVSVRRNTTLATGGSLWSGVAFWWPED